MHGTLSATAAPCACLPAFSKPSVRVRQRCGLQLNQSIATDAGDSLATAANGPPPTGRRRQARPPCRARRCLAAACSSWPQTSHPSTCCQQSCKSCGCSSSERRVGCSARCCWMGHVLLLHDDPVIALAHRTAYIAHTTHPPTLPTLPPAGSVLRHSPIRSTATRAPPAACNRTSQPTFRWASSWLKQLSPAPLRC